MNHSNCPRCEEPFRVPLGQLPLDAYAQCPWCGETFPLSEVLDRLPPMLTILSADGVPVDAVPNSVVAVSGSASHRLQHDLDDFVLAENQPAIDETVAFLDDSTIDLHPTGLSPDQLDSPIDLRPVRRKKSGGGLRSMLGMVFGAVLAVPIAGAIMWAFGIGLFADTSGQSGNSVASQPMVMPRDSEPDTDIPANDRFDAALDREPIGQIETSADANLKPEPATAAAESSVSLPQELDDEVMPSEVTITDLKPKQESSELIKTVDTAVKMIGRVNQMPLDNEKRQWALTVTYRTLARAAELAESDGPHVQELVQTIKASRILDDLAAACSDWLETTKRDNNGVILIGQADGNAIKLDSGKSVAVYAAPAPIGSGRIIVLGHIVDSQSVEAVVVDSLDVTIVGQ